MEELPLILIDFCGRYVLVALVPAMRSRPFPLNRFGQDSGEPLATDRFLVHLGTLYYPQSPGMNGWGPHFALILLGTPHRATESSDPTSLWETVLLVPCATNCRGQSWPSYGVSHWTRLIWTLRKEKRKSTNQKKTGHEYENTRTIRQRCFRQEFKQKWLNHTDPHI